MPRDIHVHIFNSRDAANQYLDVNELQDKVLMGPLRASSVELIDDVADTSSGPISVDGDEPIWLVVYYA